MRTSIYTTLLFLSLVTILHSQKNYYSDTNANWQEQSILGEIDHVIYLIGDAGEIDIPQPTTLNLLSKQLNEQSGNNSVIFLGDNIYPHGLPPKDSPKRYEAEQSINAQLNVLKNYYGNTIFIPGNHDWNHWAEDGWEAIKREANYIKSYLDNPMAFLPQAGCPGPVEISISDSVLMVVIDTQWWLHEFSKPDSTQSLCRSSTDAQFTSELRQISIDNRDKQILLVGHHPLFSNGNHGGHFSVKDHLFPLTAFNRFLYIPIPIIGSFYPILRKSFPHIQDIKHKRYQKMKDSILDGFKNHPNFIYASGHEHNLQYFKVNHQHFIVSGAGGETTHVAKKHGAGFTSKRSGFSKIIYMKNNTTWIEFWATSKKNEERGELVFRKQLK